MANYQTAALFLAILLTTFVYPVPANQLLSGDCANVTTFDQLLLANGSSKVRWVKVVSLSSISIKPKAVVVECDWADCLTCTPIGRHFDIFPDDGCHKFEVDETYLVATNSNGDDVSAMPIPVDPKQWANFRQLCHFTSGQTRHSAVGSDLKRCPLTVTDCFPDNSPVEPLLSRHVNFPATGNKCIQSSFSFQDRLAIAGAASILRLSGPYSFGKIIDIEGQPCNSANCQDLLDKNSSTCQPSFGNLQSFNRTFLMQYLSKTQCYNYDWTKRQVLKNEAYLVFHEPVSNNYNMATSFWLRADPVLLTPQLWSQIARTCYFAPCNADCLKDVILVDNRTKQTSEKTVLSFDELECYTLQLHEGRFFMAEFVQWEACEDGSVQKCKILLGKCQGNNCSYSETQSYFCPFGSSCRGLDEASEGEKFVFFAMQGNSFLEEPFLAGPCNISQWKHKLESCGCSTDGNNENVECSRSKGNGSAGKTTMETSDPACEASVDCSALQLLPGRTFYLAKYITGWFVDGRAQSWKLTVNKCEDNLNCTDGSCTDSSKTDVYSCLQGKDSSCGKLEAVENKYAFFPDLKMKDTLQEPFFSGPCTNSQWIQKLESCYCNTCNSGTYTCASPPTTAAPTTLYPPDCGEPCGSDCFAARFSDASEVYLAEATSSRNGVTVHCWLKTSSNMQRPGLIQQLWPDCDSHRSLPAPPQLFVVFAKRDPRFGQKPFQIFSAKWVEIKTLEAWQLATSFNGVSVTIPENSPPVSSYCCNPAQNNSEKAISIKNIEEKNRFPITPITTTTPSSTCEETSCPPVMCDSDCFSTRFQVASDVFWGENLPGDEAFTVSIYCWLKHSHNISDRVNILGKPHTAGRCQQGDMSVPGSGNGQYIFFVTNTISGDAARQNEFSMIAKPILVSSYAALTHALSVSSVHPSPTSRLPSFGTCEKPHGKPELLDVSVSELIKLNEQTCNGVDDSLAIRFDDINSSSKKAVIRTDATPTMEGSTSLSHFCMLTSASSLDPTIYTLQLLKGAVSDCFPNYDFYTASNLYPLVMVIKPPPGSESSGVKFIPASGNFSLASRNDSWLAITQMCSLRRLNMLGTDCPPKKNIDSEQGCFFDLSAQELTNTFNITKKREKCPSFSSDSWIERINSSSAAVYGRIKSIDYHGRSFSFIKDCIFKNSLSLDPAKDTIAVQVPPDKDGCFSIDDEAIRQNTSFILFLDGGNRMTMKEIAIADSSHVSQFASVCGSFVNGCRAKIDPRAGCYVDLAISQVLANKPLPEPRLPQCCPDLQTKLTKDVFEYADIIAWATVDAMMAVSTPDVKDDGDRLVGLSLVIRGYLKQNNGRLRTMTVLMDLGSLIAPLHEHMDYMFMLREIPNDPWKRIPYEIVSPPIPASRTVWNNYCSVCNISAKPDCLDETHCGDLVLESAKKPNDCMSEIDLLDNSTSCIAMSDSFMQRLETAIDAAAVIFGEVISTSFQEKPEDSPSPRTLISVAFPLHSPSRRVQTVTFRPICQISGDEKPSLPSIRFTYYESDCFSDDTFELFPNHRYIIFLNAQAGILTAAPILTDEKGLEVAAKSCAIHPPLFPVFSGEDAEKYEKLCPLVALSPLLCNNNTSVSAIRKIPDPTSSPTTDQSGMAWWAVLLIVVASIVCLALGGVFGAVAWRFVVAKRRRGPLSATTSSSIPSSSRQQYQPPTAEFTAINSSFNAAMSPLPAGRIVGSATDDLGLLPVQSRTPDSGLGRNLLGTLFGAEGSESQTQLLQEGENQSPPNSTKNSKKRSSKRISNAPVSSGVETAPSTSGEPAVVNRNNNSSNMIDFGH